MRGYSAEVLALTLPQKARGPGGEGISASRDNTPHILTLIYCGPGAALASGSLNYDGATSSHTVDQNTSSSSKLPFVKHLVTVKSFCYIPIVSSMTLWERGAPYTSPSLCCAKTAVPCSRFVTHMKNFSSSHKMDKLHFLPFPGFVGTHSPMTDKRRLCTTQQYIIPNTPVSTIAFDEDFCEEACSSPSPSSEMGEDDMFFTVKEEVQQLPRRPSNQAWISPFLEKQASNKSFKRLYSVNATPMEAAGRHVPLQSHPSGKPRGDSDPVLRPFTAIGLCSSASQNSSSQQINCKTSSEAVQQDKASASASASASGPLTHRDFLSVYGNALARGTRTFEMTPKHLQTPTERRAKAAIAFHVPAAKEPLPLLVGSSTHLFSKKLMKARSSAAPRPPRCFHTACSQTLSRPVVNAHLH
ncbi:uncharacterized protein C12orf42 homolog [Acomys russatus]|uniref:uncharacterized protein C12orf42 homolog n=1 Tax=Acomys russatus TaxID=60746 RepID=UPI0021E2A949|nr:uncharacterized protein C12orf42 homolog [Acomys russatus]